MTQRVPDFQKHAKHLEKFLHVYTASTGTQLKPLPNPVLRSLRHGELNGAGKSSRQKSLYCMEELAVKKPSDTMTNRYNKKELANIVREIFDMCGQPVSKNYAKQLVCLDLDTAQQCVTLLGAKRKEGNKTSLVVKGTAIYRDFDRTDIVSSDGSFITMNLIPKNPNGKFKGVDLNKQKLIDLNLVCKTKNAPGPVGLPLVLFVMWDAFKRRRGNGHKYDGIYLTVAGNDSPSKYRPSQDGRDRKKKTKAFHEAVRQQKNYKFFKGLGFEEIRGVYPKEYSSAGDPGTDVVEINEHVASIKMVFLWEQDMLAYFKRIAGENELYTTCQSSSNEKRSK